MAQKNEHNQWRKFLASRWFLLILLATSVLVSFAYGRAYYQDYQVRQEIESLKNEVKRMEAKKLETIEILKYVKSSAFIEEKARTELNLLKSGEKVAIVDKALEYEDKPELKAEQNTAELSNPMRWWRFFTQDLPN